MTSASASAACRAASAKRSSVSAPVHRVDQGDDAREAQALVEHRVGAEREQDRRRVGETGGFDDDAAKPPDLAGVAPLDEAAQRPRQVLAHGAAQATARQFEHLALDEIDQVMVDRDLADLVDDDGGVGKRRASQRAAQQRRFAAAEKAGQQGGRQGLRFGHAINHSIPANLPRIVSRRPLASGKLGASKPCDNSVKTQCRGHVGDCILAHASASCLP